MSDIYNDVVRITTDELPEEIVDRIQYLQVQFIYECGRDKTVDKFIKETEMMKLITAIGSSKKKFMQAEKYMEALVAFHRYYGGKDE